MEWESSRVQEVSKVTFWIYFIVALAPPDSIRATFSLRAVTDSSS
jgi:hypothetical protein